VWGYLASDSKEMYDFWGLQDAENLMGVARSSFHEPNYKVSTTYGERIKEAYRSVETDAGRHTPLCAENGGVAILRSRGAHHPKISTGSRNGQGP